MSAGAAAWLLADRTFARLAWTREQSAWADAARLAAATTLDGSGADRCGETWDVGLDALPNDAKGRVNGVPLGGAAAALAAGTPLHRAQVSVCLPGYPRPDPGESEARARFRRERAGAHLDGLLPIEGDPARRAAGERHLWLLGLPLTAGPAGAAPFVVWDGSEAIMAAFLREALSGVAVERWASVDVGPAYRAARAEVLKRCTRVELSCRPGGGWLVHRFALHGVAPWREGASPRGIAYFRPPAENARAWLNGP